MNYICFQKFNVMAKNKLKQKKAGKSTQGIYGINANNSRIVPVKGRSEISNKVKGIKAQ